MFTTSAEFLLLNGDEEILTKLRNGRKSLRDLSNILDLPELNNLYNNFLFLSYGFLNLIYYKYARIKKKTNVYKHK